MPQQKVRTKLQIIKARLNSLSLEEGSSTSLGGCVYTRPGYRVGTSPSSLQRQHFALGLSLIQVPKNKDPS
jgi:hypothetical protein